MWSNSARDPDIARTHDELDRRWREILIGAIRYGCDVGAFESSDPETSALLLSALIDGLSIQLTVGSANLDRERLLDYFRTAARALLGPASG